MPESAAIDDTRARLARSRAEIRRLLEPSAPSAESVESSRDSMNSVSFPRSRTMRLLLGGRGIGTLSAAVVGLLVARPTLALRLLRLVPTGAVARMVLVRVIAALRQRDA